MYSCKQKIKQLVTVIVILLICLSAFGQKDFGLKVNGGLSYMWTKTNSTLSPVQKFYWMPSGQIGQFNNYHIKDRFLIGFEFLLVQIEGKEYFEYEYSSPYKTKVTNNIRRHITYLGMPFYLGYNVKSFNFNFGFQGNLVIRSGARVKSQTEYNGTLSSHEDKVNILGIELYDYGLRAGVIIKLTRKFSIDGNYYYGLNNIYSHGEFFNTIWKVQQATVGLRYKFNRKEHSQKESAN